MTLFDQALIHVRGRAYWRAAADEAARGGQRAVTRRQALRAARQHERAVVGLANTALKLCGIEARYPNRGAA
jgi:hypothetical protein